MGFLFEHNGFINQHNSSSDTVESFNTVSSSNICISVKFKFLNKNQNNLYLEILPVYSWLAIKNQSHFPYEITSNGFGFQTALGWNHFFNKHFGFNLHSSYTAIKYKSNINNSDPFMANLYYNPQTINLEYTGFVSSLGLLVRF
ncbi:MAG: hypothetical protein AUJ97_06925 [Bacteroidetes bacterium CG2_30_32_10]|nr:MAG: hypothetical protein AUJ97_06925 [Bacteroidetes bacterium CG2_30_32_10]